MASVEFKFNSKPHKRGATNGFIFTASISKPTEFPDYLKAEHPERAFIYEVTDINNSEQSKFITVASVEALKETPYAYSKVGDQYRTNSYTKFFQTVEEVLAAKELLIRQVRALYSDVNTLFNYTNSSASDSTLILPDFVEQKVNGLIKDLISKRFDIRELETKIKILAGTALPTLNHSIAVAQGQNNVVEDIIEYFSGIDLSDVTFSQMITEIEYLRDFLLDFSGYADDLQLVIKRLRDTIRHSKVYVDNTTALAQEAVVVTKKSANTSGLSEVVLDSMVTMEGTYAAVSREMNEILNKTEGTSNVVYVPGTLYQHKVESLIRTLRVLSDARVFSSVQLDALNKMDSSIDSNIRELKKKKNKIEKEVVDYKEQIEIFKGDTQVLEGELLKLVPSIDLDHPESYWFVQVDINLGA